MKAIRPSRAESLAAQRELLVALATAQRLRLVVAVRGAPLVGRVGWRVLALAGRALLVLLAPKAASRWFGQLLGLLRDLLQRTG